MSKNNLKLIMCKRTDPIYQSIRDRHYVANHSCVGQQIHYLIYLGDAPIGIISGASAVYAVEARDQFFGLNKDNKVGLNSIIDNVVFRLEYREPNLGTQILSLWRKTIAVDWEAKYHVVVHGFETFVVEEKFRKGAMYKADNWIYLGETAGSSKAHIGENSGLGESKYSRIPTIKKLIFGKKIPGTELCKEYKSSWRTERKLLIH